MSLAISELGRQAFIRVTSRLLVHALAVKHIRNDLAIPLSRR